MSAAIASNTDCLYSIASNLLIAIIIRLTPISSQIVKWRRVWVRTPLVASIRTNPISARDAATTILRVYCSCPGASEIIKRSPFKSVIDL